MYFSMVNICLEMSCTTVVEFRGKCVANQRGPLRDVEEGGGVGVRFRALFFYTPLCNFFRSWLLNVLQFVCIRYGLSR